MNVSVLQLMMLYHDENPQHSQAVGLCHGRRHVGVELRVVVNHVELEEEKEEKEEVSVVTLMPKTQKNKTLISNFKYFKSLIKHKVFVSFFC